MDRHIIWTTLCTLIAMIIITALVTGDETLLDHTGPVVTHNCPEAGDPIEGDATDASPPCTVAATANGEPLDVDTQQVGNVTTFSIDTTGLTSSTIVTITATDSQGNKTTSYCVLQ